MNPAPSRTEDWSPHLTTPYEAVVFDMDGVIADSEPLYFVAMKDVLSPLGYEVTDVHQRAIMGHSIQDTWAYLREAFSLEGPLDALVQAYDDELVRLLGQMRETLPGVRELIEALRERGVPIAVASSSLPGWIEALLGGIELDTAFDALVSATFVAHPKPAPDVYIEAARRLGKAPERCIAIEDSPPGLKSARDAGMLTVQVRSSSVAWPPQEDAHVVLESLRDFDLGLLKA